LILVTHMMLVRTIVWIKYHTLEDDTIIIAPE